VSQFPDHAKYARGRRAHRCARPRLWVQVTGDCRLARIGVVLVVTAFAVGSGCAHASPPSSIGTTHNAGSPANPADAVPALQPRVLADIPHDPGAFTEGLALDGSTLYESSGLVGRSQLRELDPTTGGLRRAAPLPPDYWAEGIAVVGDRIWQLTYRNGVAIQWDKATLAKLAEFPFTGEGWGLCPDGDRLVRSDGSDKLHFHSSTDFAETGSVSVSLDNRPLDGLNSLDCQDGQVWANVYPTYRIVRIDPANGHVTAVVNALALPTGQQSGALVPNGIAHFNDQEFLLTGKEWPLMFRVRFEPASGR
jgi:glutamine cyclotransferase